MHTQIFNAHHPISSLSLSLSHTHTHTHTHTHLWEVFQLLFLRSIPDNLIDAEVGVVAITEPNGTTCPAHFFNCYTVLQVTKTSSTIFLYTQQTNTQTNATCC